MSPRLRPLILCVLLAVPKAALACPVCWNPREDSRLAFFWTAVLMSLLPLGLTGGLIFWLRRRIAAMSQALPEERRSELTS